MIIGHEKGRDTKEKVRRNFGMPRPEGYRKALRLMKLAERFGLPLITFIDTPGAYPGIGAEERGQSEAIARNLYEMAKLNIPTIAVVIGEGGSGGNTACIPSSRRKAAPPSSGTARKKRRKRQKSCKSPPANWKNSA